MRGSLYLLLAVLWAGPRYVKCTVVDYNHCPKGFYMEPALERCLPCKDICTLLHDPNNCKENCPDYNPPTTTTNKPTTTTVTDSPIESKVANKNVFTILTFFGVILILSGSVIFLTFYCCNWIKSKRQSGNSARAVEEQQPMVGQRNPRCFSGVSDIRYLEVTRLRAFCCREGKGGTETAEDDSRTVGQPVRKHTSGFKMDSQIDDKATAEGVATNQSNSASEQNMLNSTMEIANSPKESRGKPPQCQPLSNEQVVFHGGDLGDGSEETLFKTFPGRNNESTHPVYETSPNEENKRIDVDYFRNSTGSSNGSNAGSDQPLLPPENNRSVYAQHVEGESPSQQCSSTSVELPCHPASATALPPNIAFSQTNCMRPHPDRFHPAVNTNGYQGIMGNSRDSPQRYRHGSSPVYNNTPSVMVRKPSTKMHQDLDEVDCGPSTSLDCVIEGPQRSLEDSIARLGNPPVQSNQTDVKVMHQAEDGNISSGHNHTDGNSFRPNAGTGDTGHLDYTGSQYDSQLSSLSDSRELVDLPSPSVMKEFCRWVERTPYVWGNKLNQDNVREIFVFEVSEETAREDVERETRLRADQYKVIVLEKAP